MQDAHHQNGEKNIVRNAKGIGTADSMEWLS